MAHAQAPLAGVRIVELSIAGPAGTTTHLADLGAEVIKVEPPAGDYVRQMTWPIIEGTSLMHLHLNRGKQSVVLEAMRPGMLARRGVGYDVLRERNPRLVFCSVSGYGMTGPYTTMPSHGIAYDTWAGVVTPEVDEEGFTHIPEHVSIGMYAAPMLAATSILAAVIRARATGEGSFMELGQSDAAAFFDWYRSETWLAYRRPESQVTGNPSDDHVRRAPGTAGMKEGVRYQIYETTDGYVLFMASEQAFWRNFCQALDRMDLFERWPGATYADHARGNRELQAELREIFRQRTSAEWIRWSDEVNTPIAPVNSPETLPEDPQFQARFPLLHHERHGADMLPYPVNFADESLPDPAMAPSVGEHTDRVVADVLGVDADRLAELRAAGAFGNAER